jgi:hypothetical protein
MRGRAHALIPAVVFILCFGACQRKGNGSGTSLLVLPPAEGHSLQAKVQCSGLDWLPGPSSASRSSPRPDTV